MKNFLRLFVFMWLMASPSMAIEADETGMVPGDIVFGNVVNFPGHAGIYIGKWTGLPANLQAKYKQAFDETIIRSRDHGLKNSFLVVDSMGGKGVRVRSFVEQFTGYMPTGQSTTLKNALRWEAKTGGAMRWPALATGDSRRWNVVEEALKAAMAHVPYDGSHWQLATTTRMPEVREGISFWQEGIQEAKSLTSYDDSAGLDCIALVHVAYWRGARLDLDVSWKPWHTPEQLYIYSLQNNLLRNTELGPVFAEAAVNGLWDLKIRTVQSGSDANFNGDLPAWVETQNGVLAFGLYEAGGPVRPKELSPIDGRLAHTRANTMLLEETDTGGNHIRVEILADGLMSGSLSGIDDDGPFRISIIGKKRLDYLNVR